MTVAMTSAQTTMTMPALAPASSRGGKNKEREEASGGQSQQHHQHQQGRRARRGSPSPVDSTSSEDSYDKFLRERAARKAPPTHLYPSGRYEHEGEDTAQQRSRKPRKNSDEQQREQDSAHRQPARASPPLFHLHRKGKPPPSDSADSGSPGRYLLPRRSGAGLETGTSSPGPTTNQSSFVTTTTTTTATRSVGVNTTQPQAKRDFTTKTYTHEKSREEMQREFDRRSREHHRNFLRLCGRLTKKGAGKGSVQNNENGGFNNTLNGTLTGVTSFNNTMTSRGQVSEAGDPHGEFNQTFNQTFNGTIPLAAALKDLPISEDTITNTNRDDELNYATHVLPLVEQAARDEDGDPMVFGLGTIGIAAREREREKQRYQQIQENGGVPPDSGRRGKPLPGHLNAINNPPANTNGNGNEHVQAVSPKAMSVFERLRQRQAPTSKSCSVARREQMRMTNGSAAKPSRFDDENQRAFTMTEFLSLQRLIKFGLPLNAAIEALRRLNDQNDRAKEREAAEAAAAAAAVNVAHSPAASPHHPRQGHLPPVDSAPPSACGTAQGVDSRDGVDGRPTGSRAGRRLPGLPALTPAPEAGGGAGSGSGTKEPAGPQLLTPLNQPGSQPGLFRHSLTGAAGDPASNTFIPPAPPAPPPPGGVMDTFGYFSTHRVQPLYYHQLESSSGGVDKTPSCSSISPSASSLNNSSGTVRRKKKNASIGNPPQPSSRNSSITSLGNSSNRRRKQQHPPPPPSQRQGSPPPSSMDSSRHRESSLTGSNNTPRGMMKPPPPHTHQNKSHHSDKTQTNSETQTQSSRQKHHNDELFEESSTSSMRHASGTRRPRGVSKEIR